MQSELNLRNYICEIGRRLWIRGYVAANDGNITVRLPEGYLLSTPTGVSKGFMTPDMIIKVDLAGNVICGDLAPSSELLMHLAVYKRRSDVNAVVHAHPPAATGFAVAGRSLCRPVTPEVIVSLGEVPLAPYGTPSTLELAASIVDLLPNHDGMLLQNHGVLTLGADLYSAYFKMETIELAAQVSLNASLLGGAREIEPENVERLVAMRRKMPGY